MDPLVDILPIITTVTLMGGMLFGAVRWLSGQAEKKAERIKDAAEKTAMDLKITAERTAHDLKKLTEDIAKDTRIYTDSHDKTAREYYDVKSNDMLLKIGDVDRKVMEMLGDLKTRADLTNGNVALIRTEIQDLNDDIQSIYEDKQDVQNVDPNDVSKRKHAQQRQRRLKRRSIEADRVAQSERILSRQHG